MNSILVKFTEGITGSSAAAIVERYSGTIKWSSKRFEGMHQVQLLDDADNTAIIKELNDLSVVKYAEENTRVELDYTPNDPQLEISDSSWHHDVINSYEAWDKKRDAEDIFLGIADSEFLVIHEDLADNFYTDPETGEIGWNAAEENYILYNGIAHGTSVAGIAGAVGNNAKGGCGICHSVKLVPIKVAYDDTSIDIAAVVRAVEYALEKELNVLNISFSVTGYSSAFDEAMAETEQAGMIVCTSAGNNGVDLDVDPNQKYYPQSFPYSNIIVVMASNLNNQPTSEGTLPTSYGLLTVDIAAPGGGTDDGPGVKYYAPKGDAVNGYTPFGHTSGATPIVAGTAALLLAVLSKSSKGVKPYPETADFIKEIIIETAQVLPAFSGKCVAGGIVDVQAAVDMMFEKLGDAEPIASAQKGKLV